MNKRGQFSIIAALLVAVVLIATVITTYSAIRYSAIQDQPQVLSTIDETNLALKQVLGFTVGYYGSVLQVTGNSSYANMLSSNYLTSGLENIADSNPESGASFNVTTLDLSTNWFTNASYSAGNMVVKYDLSGLGIYGISYNASCRLDVQVSKSPSSTQACLSIFKDENEPLINLGKQNFKFYRYRYSNLTWEFGSPSGGLTAFMNGTYLIDFPSGIDSSNYVVQVKDTRGIMVAAASFSHITSTLMWNTTSPQGPDYVDINTTDVDSSPNKGTQSNFTAQQFGPDSIFDTLTEGTGVGSITHENSAQSYSPTGRSSHSFNYPLQKGSGNNRLVVVTVSWEDAQASASISSLTFGGTVMTKIADVTVGTGSSEYISLWYLLDASLPSSAGSYSIAVTVSESITREIYVAVAEYSGVKQSAPDDYDTHSNTSSGNTAITITAAANGSIVVAGVGEGDTNPLTNTNNISNLREQVLTSSGSALGHHTNVSSGNITVGWNNLGAREGMVGAVWQPNRFSLDLEEQWTNVNLSYPRQDLCIKTGTLGPENLAVDVRTGSSWTTVINSLQPNAWNNVSVTLYISSPNFTIRFRDGGSSTNQTSWYIDAVMLSPQPDIDVLLSKLDHTIVIELLQNGTMRWLGQSLSLTTQEKPVPPVPVKAIHMNQTINGVNQEVPFQVEDWASEYRIPLGLTNNATVFSNRQMIVFLVNVNVSKVTVWWNGSDTATQTPLAYTNRYFSVNPSSRTLSNSRLTIQFASSGFKVTSTLGTTSSTANFMRINSDEDDTDPELAYVIVNGTVRAIVQGEPEWSGGVANCPNVYANTVYTLPANATYYTYQLRLIFVNSTGRPRTITDLCPIKLSTSLGSVTIQTEDGTVNTSPIVATGTGTFKNYSASGAWTAHHWSQFNSTTGAGAGIMFTNSTNQLLYALDPTATASTGSLNVSATAKTIEFSPVTQSLGQVSMFTTSNTYDITWHGAVATFDGTATATPIYTMQGTAPTGLWILVEYQPKITVTSES